MKGFEIIGNAGIRKLKDSEFRIFRGNGCKNLLWE